MANRRSCCCSGLSKGWWWLLTLLGLSLLYFLMFSAKRGVIEEDLHTRTTQQLGVEGADWSHVDIDYRGRDVLLTGTASSELEREAAIKTALGVRGVRIVENNIDVVPLKERSLTANYKHEDGMLVIEGVLSSQNKVDEIFNILVARLGSDKIVNKLTVDDEYSNKGGGIVLSGSVLNDDALSEVSSVVKSGSSVLGLQLTNNLIIDKAASEAKKLAADKLAAEQAEADKLAAKQAEADKLAAEQAEADKLAAEQAEADKLAAKQAEADKLAAEQTEADKLAAKQAEADKLAAEKAEADKLAARQTEAAEKAKAEKLVAVKVEVNACQTKLNNTMLGKTILFETNKANIKKSSFSLLQKMANVINECSTALPDAKIAVSGHTDSRGSDAYNLSLSERRANAVRKYLTGIGVSDSIITSKGYGESQPKESNDTAEGRAQNRRITFSVK